MIEQLRREHLLGFEIQDAQPDGIDELQNELLMQTLIDNKSCFSFVEAGTGICLAIMGYYHLGKNRYHCFSYLHKEAGRRLSSITRMALGIIDSIPNYRRLELVVRGGFNEGHRWASMLGFNCETPNGMQNFVEGETHYLYARCK